MTGHTGFKGSWLALRLSDLGADVTGYALSAETDPSAYELLRIAGRISDLRGDVGDAARLRDAISSARPQIVVHLAAQPLVRRSYREPAQTIATNVMGTVHLLEAVRATPGIEAVLVVTSDKTYANHQTRPLRESDHLGGDDPYSASKACAEIVAGAYRASFFSEGPALATARAGNVIGGGDWSEDRLIPDLVRASSARQSAVLRYPDAVRPWQHVADVIDGYVILMERLHRDRSAARAWNFGPRAESGLSVGSLARRFLAVFDSNVQIELGPAGFAEKHYLQVDSQLAREELGWRPRYDADAAIAATAQWYAAWRLGADLVELTRAQLRVEEVQPAAS
jgi:CDP-glucose 4,6-dehydratase